MWLSSALGWKNVSIRSTSALRSAGSSLTLRTLAKLRKSSSTFCSRWHSRCTMSNFIECAAVARRDGIGKILGQQLHVEHDRRERVLDLVRKSAGQRGDLVVLIDQPLASRLSAAACRSTSLSQCKKL